MRAPRRIGRPRPAMPAISLKTAVFANDRPPPIRNEEVALIARSAFRVGPQSRDLPEPKSSIQAASSGESHAQLLIEEIAFLKWRRCGPSRCLGVGPGGGVAT